MCFCLLKALRFSLAAWALCQKVVSMLAPVMAGLSQSLRLSRHKKTGCWGKFKKKKKKGNNRIGCTCTAITWRNVRSVCYMQEWGFSSPCSTTFLNKDELFKVSSVSSGYKCRNSTLTCLKFTPLLLYVFIKLWANIITNVYSNVRTQRKPHIYSFLTGQRSRSTRQSVNGNKTVQHYLVSEQLCPCHVE